MNTTDIGTSPLYALKTAVEAATGGGIPMAEAAIGVLSLIIWSLIVVVSVKYIVFVMRADNHGEGGILALLTLAKPWSGSIQKKGFLIALGIFGAALLYGDGVITPAISVLSAMEGLSVATTAFDPFVKPLAMLVLICLFLFQSKGTAKIGRLFGPVMVLWFTTIGFLGIDGILKEPIVLMAINPIYAINILTHHIGVAFAIFGAVFLAVTGGEAMYADMGHVGKQGIRIAWLGFVLPTLLLNYAGQAALLISDPKLIDNPFYHLASEWMVIPLVILSAAATIIASQALITGVFSLTRQASNLGLLPRVNIKQTSSEGYGQIYIPVVNWSLMLATLLMVGMFKNSDGMAAAYGVAVSATMVITTLLLFQAMINNWKWSPMVAYPLTGIFLAIDGSFLVSNLTKIPEGGWLPVMGGLFVYYVMELWSRGAEIVSSRLNKLSQPLPAFLCYLEASELTKRLTRISGTAVFLTKVNNAIPPGMLKYLRHSRTIHETMIFLNVKIAEVPRIPAKERYELADLGQGIYTLVVNYGFMQHPNIPVVIRGLHERKIIKDDPETVCYFVGHERIVGNDDNMTMQGMDQNVFAFLSHNSAHITDYFKIPDDQVMEVGIRVEV